MANHGLICGGIRRRIGDGTSTSIWEHPWLFDSDFRIHTPMPHQLQGSKVSGLIDQDTQTWDLAILTYIFDPQDVNRILRVPVCPSYEDSWYCYNDPNGAYSVKSGYRCVLGEIANTPGFEKWAALWKLKVPPKWKTFLWRAVSGILPTTTNLLVKRVDIDPSCPMCTVFHEDTMHTFLECTYVIHVWNESHLPISCVTGDCFAQWLQNAMTFLTEDVLIKVIAVLYQIWGARHTAVWEAYLYAPRHTWTVANNAVAAWHAAGTRFTGASRQQHSVQFRPGWRCFVDAGRNPDTGAATFGGVLIAEDGGFIAAVNGKLPYTENIITAEALACKEILSWLKARDVTEITVYTNCSVLQGYINRPNSPPRSYTGVVIRDCKSIMDSFFFLRISFDPSCFKYFSLFFGH
ncbi:PREDICTED: uncharacterized protein LOC109151968 [Ipomoea nil]|uniref:uncharacterized protein LOC109151968 n=1 Tax=Ipomoea nil TaxID=35883 RepID=UPI00090155FD|nr:PREDICTED: uncharacterized protein LOC109151968 [Ipomoea nil]